MEVPHFGPQLLTTVLCSKCGYRHTETKPIGKAADHGTRITLRMATQQDLNRELILSETARISLPELELELELHEGVYTTVEGLLNGAKTQSTVQ